MDDLPLLLTHAEDFFFQPVFAVGAEILHVHRILADQFVYFRLERRGMREIILSRVRCEKTSNADAINLARRIIRWHSNNDRPLPFPRQLVPHCQRLDGRGIREAQLFVRMVHAIAEAVHAERTGVLAGAHAHPSGHSDGWNHTFKTSVHAHVHQAADVHQAFVTENHFRRSAIESKNADFHFRVVNYLPWFAELELLDDSGLWAQGQ